MPGLPFGKFVHDIDPVIARVGPIELWWYGLAYSLGLLGAHLWLRLRRRELRLTKVEIWDLSLLLAGGLLIGARVFDVLVYERSFYAANPHLLPCVWRGGMASHGVLLGSVIGVIAFCRIYGRRFLPMIEVLLVPGAILLALGRIGNFINGQLTGSLTDVPWAVWFPYEEGYRHPVTLYESAKNLLLVPILLWVRRSHPPGQGVMLGAFLLGYGGLRVLTDIYRVYEVTYLGLPAGQWSNLVVAAIGLGVILSFSPRARRLKPAGDAHDDAREGEAAAGRAEMRRPGLWRPIVFALLVLLALSIPSAWTQEVFQKMLTGE